MGESHSYRKAAVLVCGLLFIILLVAGGLFKPVMAQGDTLIQANFEAESLYLPLILKLYPVPYVPPTPTPTSPPGDHPQDGAWVGTTSRNHPMSFTVQSGGTQWASFTVTTDFYSAKCGASVTLEVKINGPGGISDNRFAYDSTTYDFTGDFIFTNAAIGNYAFANYPVYIGIPWPPYICNDYLTQDGTWNANR